MAEDHQDYHYQYEKSAADLNYRTLGYGFASLFPLLGIDAFVSRNYESVHQNNNYDRLNHFTFPAE